MKEELKSNKKALPFFFYAGFHFILVAFHTAENAILGAGRKGLYMQSLYKWQIFVALLVLLFLVQKKEIPNWALTLLHFYFFMGIFALLF